VLIVIHNSQFEINGVVMLVESKSIPGILRGATIRGIRPKSAAGMHPRFTGNQKDGI
jgi:hypothetical protein